MRTSRRVEPARERLARCLKAIRTAEGLTQTELADKAGLHRTFVGQVERATRNVSIDNVERLATSLNVDITDLLQPI